jgi:pilus assembly protein Flp/PilA
MLDYVCSWTAVRIGKRGVTAVEYGIMAALIATILVAAVTTFGGGLKTSFGNIATHLTTGK